MKKGQKLYYKACLTKEKDRVYRKPQYGYEITIWGNTFYCQYNIKPSPAFKWLYITEKTTGYCCTIGEAVVNPQMVANSIEKLPPVESYPTLKELQGE